MTISFRRNGSILVDGIRVGWIDQREDGRWLVRFTHASGLRMGVLDHFPRLKDAKAASRMHPACAWVCSTTSRG